MIEEIRYADGRIGIVKYIRLERPLNRKSTSGNNISLQGSVFYGALSLMRTTVAAKSKSMAMQSWNQAGHWDLSILLLKQ